AELAEHQKAKILSRLKPVLEKPAIVKKQMQAIEDLKEEGYTAEEIAAGILALYLGVPTEEKPAFSERERGRDRSERGDRPGRSRRSGVSDGMIRLFINVGKKDRVSPGDIVGAFAGEAKISGKDIGQIDIYDKFSFVNVNSITAEKIMHGMKNNSIKGRKINIEIAKQ
ncbi:MAG TPA: DbpA RNA binding domain-containing protein, partial [Cytophagaceae bacterium]